jgi:hypothetical protein
MPSPSNLFTIISSGIEGEVGKSGYGIDSSSLPVIPHTIRNLLKQEPAFPASKAYILKSND